MKNKKSAFDMLSRAHRRIEEESAALVEALTRAEEVLAFLRRSGANHTADEEESLFARIDGGELAAQLTREHRHHESLLDKIDCSAALAAAKELEQAYRAHTELEDCELLPLVEALPESDKEELAREMRARRGKG